MENPAPVELIQITYLTVKKMCIRDRFNSDGNGSGSFTLYNRWGVEAAGSSPDGQFFPFNTGDEVFDERNGQLVEQQINTSQGHRDLISTDEVINHYFGLNMSTRFIQQNGGYTAPDGTQGRQEVTYNFSGCLLYTSSYRRS